MLWKAGQTRLEQEQRARLAEHFVASRDAALDVMVATGQAKSRGAWRLPSYVRGDSPARTGSPVQRDAILAKLGVMFPGMVRRSDS
jgi:hypothetical protein